MYNTLTIERFRGIEYLTTSGLRRMNLILGMNNAGKTSVLESLFLLEVRRIPHLLRCSGDPLVRGPPGSQDRFCLTPPDESSTISRWASKFRPQFPSGKFHATQLSSMWLFFMLRTMDSDMTERSRSALPPRIKKPRSLGLNDKNGRPMESNFYRVA